MDGVALLAEGVDRNPGVSVLRHADDVALLAEGVDRNFVLDVGHAIFDGRPPRGGRG